MTQWFQRAERLNEARPAAEDESRGVEHIRSATLGALLGSLILALGASMITTWAGAGIAFVLAISLTASGFVVGLLFSMPRAVAVAADILDRAGKADIPDATASSGGPIYAINTNLEQISDWLTKIIVGVGLVEAGRLAQLISRSAVTLGDEFHRQQHSLDSSAASGLALGMIVGFPTLGFLIGFFSVKLYIARAVYAADAAVLRPVVFSQSEREVVDLALTGTLLGLKSPRALASSPAIDAILNVPIERLKSADDLLTRGKAAFLKGLFDEAADAFERALQQRRHDPEILAHYARALRRTKKRPWSEIVTLLDDAKSRINARTTSDVRKQIMRELLNAHLYMDPPEGFTAAIKLGENYSKTDDGRNDAFGLVYQAAAHGQAYNHWSARDPARAASAADSVRRTITRALEVSREQGVEEAAIRRWLQSLATSSSEDDDLKRVVEENPELKKLLGLDQSTMGDDA